MRKRTVGMLAGAALVLTTGIGTGVAVAANGDDTDVPITGDALDRASAAALAHTGGGRVTGTEVGDEDSYYEVEVTLTNGNQVDVQLTEAFEVVSSADDVEDGGTD
jgi:hypothetical protein